MILEPTAFLSHRRKGAFVTVEGYTLEAATGLALEQPDGHSTWVVVHLPTGLTLPGDFWSLGVAAGYLEAIGGMCAWGRMGSAAVIPDAVKTAAHAIALDFIYKDVIPEHAQDPLENLEPLTEADFGGVV